MSPKDFITKILVEKLHSKHLIVGYDFKFGKDRKGNASLLQEQSKIFGFDMNIIQPITSNYNALMFIHHHELENSLGMAIWKKLIYFSEEIGQCKEL